LHDPLSRNPVDESLSLGQTLEMGSEALNRGNLTSATEERLQRVRVERLSVWIRVTPVPAAA